MDRVLFVDDEEKLLAGMRRNLRKNFDVHTALSGAEALEQIKSNGPFSVIVSDMQMPEMNGVEFLVKAKVLTPDSIRIMLTGNADQQTAVEAINTGDVHQFLTKPCESPDMIKALEEAAEAFRRRKIEKDLLERTFQASVEVLVEIMSLANPAAFGRSARLADLAVQIAEAMNLDATWSVRSAALFSQMGCINLPEPVVAAIAKGDAIGEEAWQKYTAQSAQSAELIAKIPRLEEVADGVRFQYKNFNGTGAPDDSVEGKDIPQIARILRVTLEADSNLTRGNTADETIELMEKNAHLFDPDILAALTKVLATPAETEQRRVEVKSLTPNMVTAEDVVDNNGVLLICRGWETSETIIKHLVRAAENGLIEGAILVSVAA